jgi:cyclophilin family peptidyl-prolyl cis-trans isomerase
MTTTVKRFDGPPEGLSMRAVFRRFACCFGAVAVAATLCVAQGAAGDKASDDKASDDKASDDKAADDKGKEPTTGAQSEEANAAQQEFNQIFGQFKKVLGQLRSLQGKYQLADESERSTISAEFDRALAEGKDLAPRLLAAAKKAYGLAPNANREVADYLFASLVDADQSDNYPAAIELSKLLIDGGYDDKDLYNYAGVAAFSSDEFDLAKEWFAKAGSKTLSPVGRKDMESVDEYQKLWPEEQKLREAEAKADDLPRVKLKTTKGDIVVELFENEAPNTVANFINLVEKHFYDNTPFHRVLAGFMAQGGDPQGTGQGGPDYHIACECYEPNHRNHFAGSLSMAHAGRDTGGSQFFLTFAPTPHLNGKHTVFGRVIEGMDVLPKLERTEAGKAGSPPPDKIIEATVLRKRKHAYVPVKVGQSQ